MVNFLSQGIFAFIFLILLVNFCESYFSVPYEVFAKNFVALCKAIDFALFLHKYSKQGKKRLFQKCLPFLNSMVNFLSQGIFAFIFLILLVNFCESYFSVP